MNQQYKIELKLNKNIFNNSKEYKEIEVKIINIKKNIIYYNYLRL